MIHFSNLTFRYGPEQRPVLRDVDFAVNDGALCLVVGLTGTGKSTLLKSINGLVPRFTGGRLSGHVTVDGRDTAHHSPGQLADVVGYVGQDPAAGFVTDTVEDELAYILEQLAVTPNVMRTRVEETLDLLGLTELRRRSLADLSGGQQQRVAIGAVMTAHPRVLVLDEPTSELDPTAAEELLSTVARLVHDLGVTVVLAEHRLERVVQYADQVAHLDVEGRVRVGRPDEIMPGSDVVPPVVGLARLAGWEPPPLTVREARRMAEGLRERLDRASRQPPARPSPVLPAQFLPAPVLVASGISVVYAEVVAVRNVSVELMPGEVVALMGRNGSGKSSLLWALQGSGSRKTGRVIVDGFDPADLAPDAARRRVGLVPQTATDLLYRDTVTAECAQSDRDAAVLPGTTQRILDRLLPGIVGARHPRDLSEGQRLAVVLAIQLSASPKVVLLDEPTRGLDYAAKRRLAATLISLVRDGLAVVVSTHDVEFAAAVADRVIVMAEGEVVADGSTDEVVLASPAFAPQVAKIMAPDRWLTVDQIEVALAGELQGSECK